MTGLLILWLLAPLLLLAAGLFIGTLVERRHLSDLQRREAQLDSIFVTDVGDFFAGDPAGGATLIVSEVVIASDYFKTFAAGLRGLIGGEIRSYVSMTTRAHREALLRLKEQAQRDGYDALCNVRLNSADVGGNVHNKKGGLVMVALLASATAYRRRRR